VVIPKLASVSIYLMGVTPISIEHRELQRSSLNALLTHDLT
jgi:hypothetical protein